jgi:NAD-specific glutamate dehydrogenase
LEFLPSDEEIAERRQAGEGLTRPELAIILSYGKIWFYRALIHSDVPEDPYLSTELNRYFPTPVQKRFAQRIRRHRLRREIIATAITNSLINRMGPVFPVRAQDDTGADPAAIARAYSIAREVFAVRNIWAEIEGLDNKIAASVQYTAMFQTTRLLRHMSYWLLENRRNDLDIKRAVSRYAGKVSELFHELGDVLGVTQKARMSALRSQLVEQHVPEQLAARIASLEELHSALDLVEVARTARVRIGYAARAYLNRDLARRRALAGGRARHAARELVRVARQDHAVGAQVQRPGTCRAGGSMAFAAFRTRRCAQAAGRGPAHRLAAGLCDDLGGAASGPTARALTCNRQAPSAPTICRTESIERSCWPGPWVSSSNRRMT